MKQQIPGSIQQTNPLQGTNIPSSSIPQNIAQTRGTTADLAAQSLATNLTGGQTGQAGTLYGKQHLLPGQQQAGTFPGQQQVGGLLPGQQQAGTFPGQQTGSFPGQQVGGYSGQQPGSLLSGQQQAGTFPGQQTGTFPGQQTGTFPGKQTPYTSGQTVLPGHHTIGTTGVGTITFRPIEGRFLKDKDWVGKMDPYCKFKIGWRSGKSSVAKSQGLNANWAGEAIELKVKNHEYAKLKVKDKDRLRPDDRIGSAEIPLAQLMQQRSMKQWIPITKNNTVTGEVLVEMMFNPQAQGQGQGSTMLG